jgi:outer membrane protein assembly factor BamB
MSRHLLFAAVLAGLAGLSACTAADAPAKSAADWPQFRGPNRDNISADKGLLKSWPKDGPKVIWKAEDIGEGFSSVAVVGDFVYTMGDKDGACWVLALNKEKGDLAWSAKIGKAGGNRNPGPRGTPTVDGDLLYVIGTFGDLVCLETAKGTEKWRKSFGKDFGGRNPRWDFAESPLVDGDRLVCTPGGPKASMVVLDKKTGEEIWRAGLKQGAGYASIVISNAGNVKQYVQVTSAGTIGVAAKDGKLLWHYERFSGNTANIPTPIVLGDEVFTTVGYGKGSALLKLSPDGDGVKSTEEYHTGAMTNKHGGVLIVGDYVYGDAGDNGNVSCFEWKTGKVKWMRNKGKRGKGSGSASVTYADGMLYVHFQNGWVSLVQASPDAFVEESTFRPTNPKEPCWAHPVVTGGRLYIRQRGTLWCYDVKAK